MRLHSSSFLTYSSEFHSLVFFFKSLGSFFSLIKKLSTFSPISLILATSSGSSDRWLRDGGGWCHAELERCRSGRALARLKKFSFLSAAGFLVFFGKIITGSELIDLVQYILPRFTTILKPSVRNRWTVANLLLNVLETYAIKSGITKLEYFESIITVTILLFAFSHHRIKDEIYFETKWLWLYSITKSRIKTLICFMLKLSILSKNSL